MVVAVVVDNDETCLGLSPVLVCGWLLGATGAASEHLTPSHLFGGEAWAGGDTLHGGIPAKAARSTHTCCIAAILRRRGSRRWFSSVDN